MTRRLREKGLPLAVSILASAGFVAAWQLRNHAYPLSDAARNLAGAWDLYHGAPVAGPPFVIHAAGAALLALTAGNALATVALWTTSCQVVFTTSLFLYLSRNLSPWRSAFGAVFLSLLPGILFYSILFEPYVAFLGLGLGAAYCLIESDGFSRPRQAIGFAVLLAATFSFRPFETLVLFTIPILQAAFQGLRAQKLFRLELVFASVLATTAGAVSFLRWRSGIEVSRGMIWGFVGALGAGGALLRWRNRLLSPFFLGFVGFFCWFCAWFLPASGGFYEWAFRWTFAPALRLTSEFAGRNPLHFLWGMSVDLGGWALLAIAIIAAVSLVAGRKRIRPPRAPESGFLAGTLILLGTGMLTRTDQDCYFLASYLVFGLLLAQLALNKEPPFSRFRAALFLIPLAIQLQYAWSAVLPSPAAPLLLSAWHEPLPRPSGCDVNRALLLQVAGTVGADRPIRLHMLLLLADNSSQPRWIATAGALALQAKLLDPSWTLRWRGPTEERSARQQLSEIANSSDYVLVGPLGGSPNPYRIHSKELPLAVIRGWEAHRLGALGYSFVREIEVSDRAGKSAKFLLVRPVLRPALRPFSKREAY